MADAPLYCADSAIPAVPSGTLLEIAFHRWLPAALC